MASLIKTIIKAAWLVSTYTIIIGHVMGFIPPIVAGLPDLQGVQIIVKVLGGVIGTIRWFLTPGLFTVVCYIWLLLPAVKLTIYLSHKATHV